MDAGETDCRWMERFILIRAENKTKREGGTVRGDKGRGRGFLCLMLEEEG